MIPESIGWLHSTALWSCWYNSRAQHIKYSNHPQQVVLTKNIIHQLRAPSGNTHSHRDSV